MVSSDSTGGSAERTATQFATTHWSVVLAAADSASPGAQEALGQLCRTYWYPLYAFVRLKGYPPEDAEDLTQAFFERFLQKRAFKSATAERGRFRSFLLTALQYFLCDQFDRATAIKRGGDVRFIPLDTLEAEAQVQEAAVSQHSPEMVFDRAWADTVVGTSLDRLRAAYEAEGRGVLFAELSPYLSSPAERAGYSDSARRLDMDAESVAMAVMRLRRRYRALVRAEVANTVATPAEIDDEMRYLVELLAV